MANSVMIQELNNGAVNYVIAVNIVGDGSGQITHEPLVDAGLLNVDTLSIQKVTANMAGFDAILEWGGATNAVAMHIPDGTDAMEYDFIRVGGLQNPKVANYTGDLCLTTIGLAAGEEGFMLIECRKKF